MREKHRRDGFNRCDSRTLRNSTIAQHSGIGQELLRLPLIDALGRRDRIEQLYLPDLTINYNYRQVARFDRCPTCHQAMDKALPGTWDEPAYRRRETLQVQLATPKQAPRPKEDPQPATAPTLADVYGFSLADRGMLGPGAATVGLVLPETAAAHARALGRRRDSQDQRRPCLRGLRRTIAAAGRDGMGEACRAGNPSRAAAPVLAHPRPELFVAPGSPHPMNRFGCTICHDGQGSATDFQFASHTPDDPVQRARWHKEYGWVRNPDWDFPMRPSRFAQSNCLKCHHEVSDLEPSPRFPEPPADKLLAGYHLVRRNGCFGCHEIKGVTDGGESIGPDMRLEPNYHEAAQELLANCTLSPAESALARQIVLQPEDAAVRKRLVAILAARCEETAKSTKNTKESRRLIAILAAEIAHPGTMRKVGPSLRNVAGKLDAAFTEAFLANPAEFRPQSRMPRFFGMHEHLEGRSLDEAKRFEAVEIRASPNICLP